MKSLLVKVLIYRKRALDLGFERRISLENERIIVKDLIQGSIGPRIESLRWVDLFTTIHMGSSRYFVPNELLVCEGGSSTEVDLTQLEQGVTIVRTIEIR